MTQTAAMAEKELTKIYNQLKANHAARASGTSLPPKEVLKLANDGQLRVARLGGMNVTALPPHLLTQARLIYEQGALAALELGDSYKFKGFVEKVKPIYEWQMGLKEDVGDMNKIMALYLLYLLTKQEYSEFHIQLEWLHTWKIDYEADRFLAYPIKMEQWIHLGGQDIVWKAMKEGQVPSKEFNAFTPVRNTSSCPVEHASPEISLLTILTFHSSSRAWFAPNLRNLLNSPMKSRSPSPQPRLCSSSNLRALL